MVHTKFVDARADEEKTRATQASLKALAALSDVMSILASYKICRRARRRGKDTVNSGVSESFGSFERRDEHSRLVHVERVELGVTAGVLIVPK